MSYMEEAKNRAETLIKTISDDKTISKETKVLANKYIDFMRARGLTDRTISKNLYCLATFFKTIKKKDPLKLTKEDIMHSIAAVERTDYSAKTKQNIKISVKAFYKHIVGNDDYYPDQVRWIKSSLSDYKRILPEDILTEEDVSKLLEVTSDVRDKAIIALLFDSGMRVGEMINMKIKDVDLTTEPLHIRLSGKTGMRQIPIMFSGPYMGAYLGTQKEKKPDGPLWTARGTLIKHNRAIDRSGIASILKIAATKAGITKRVNPHSFRHARATYYANRLTEQQLKMFFGWTGDSRQASTYVHLSGRDLDNSIMQAHGMKVPELQQPKLKLVLCPRCRSPNGFDMMYCGKCGGAMDIGTAMKVDEMSKTVKKSLAETSEDPEFRSAVDDKMISRRKRGRRDSDEINQSG